MGERGTAEHRDRIRKEQAKSEWIMLLENDYKWSDIVLIIVLFFAHCYRFLS